MTEKVYNEQPDDVLYSKAGSAIAGKHRFKYCVEEDRFYVYQNGYWKEQHELEMLAMVNEVTRITQYPIARRRQILENMKYLTKMRLELFNTWPLFNLENYMVDPMGKNVSAHLETYYSTNRIPYAYDNLATCPLWIKTLMQIFEGDKQRIDVLQEFIGYCLCPGTKMKKALLLLGESNSGKSTLLFTIADVLGKENCSHVPLKLINNPQFTPLMVNKLVNIDEDVDKHAQDYEADFKKITSGEPVHCNQKFIKSFYFTPKCKIILAANEFPRITDHSSAFYNRLILIPCERVFKEKEQNRELATQLKAELPGIFNWAAEGLRKLSVRGSFEECSFIKDAVKRLEDANNPSNAFFEENIITDVSNEFYLDKGELYQRYVKWAKETNTGYLSLNRFSECVYKKYSKYTPKNTRHPQTMKRIWRNLRYLNGPTERSVPSWEEEPASFSNITDAKEVDRV